jgi:hypothetical protein
VTDEVTELGAGHDWRETWVRARFPLVCLRCMTRSDSPAAQDPCDRVTEVLTGRDDGGESDGG